MVTKKTVLWAAGLVVVAAAGLFEWRPVSAAAAGVRRVGAGRRGNVRAVALSRP